MAKKFNITGTCIPDRHYMADTSGKLEQVMALVEQGEYFIINRPRQYGKTTTLFLVLKKLEQTEQYLPFSISFEGVGDQVFQEESSFCQMFLSLLEKQARWKGNTELANFLEKESQAATELKLLSESISRLVEKAGKKLVLLIDEVDKSSNNQLFVSFLGMLRTKFLAAAEERDLTFHSVVLAGVHDVKTLKLKLRPDAEQKFNSPWNIAADFKVEMSLLPAEILPMLLEYSRDKGVKMDAPQLAERLFYFTSGYPFLVSKLCKVMDEDMPPASEWTTERLEEA
ncbi:MAG: AAA-like domain-containing protein, partial [Bacteroidota bacterium]